MGASDSADEIESVDLDADNVIRPDFEAGAPPPPPEFGTVLPAPPPSSADLQTVSDPAASGPQKSSRFLFGALGVAVALGAAGFLLGRTGSGDGSTIEQAKVSAANVTPDNPVDPPPPQEPSDPVVVPAKTGAEPRCPSGMVLVEGGRFFKGTDSEDPVLAASRPAHQVSVDPFCIDRTEVTLGAYRECSRVGECKRAYRDSWWPQGSADAEQWDRSREEHSTLCNENYDNRDNHPVNCVTWKQAKTYCRWRGAKLPTESQWEFAARGSDGRIFPWGDAAPDSEHLNGCGSECTAWQEESGLSKTRMLYEQDDGFPGTAPVGSFPSGKTSIGLADMAGNVFEWTADSFEAYPGAPEPATARGRVIRGGAFNSFLPQFADPALRFAQSPNAHTDGIGFRCVSKPRR